MVEPGVTIDSRFRLDRLAGSGSAAEVWRAVDLGTGQPCALKLLSAQSAQVKRRFLREAQLARRLAHPNVVRVIEAIDDPCCLVLEWVEGPTLADRLAAGPIALADAEAWFRGVAEAVAHAHAHGVVHRDLKPANILLAGDVPKVTDFGIARDMLDEGITATGTVLGTPWYMAPEQVRHARAVDHRADVWALGVILYELVCGVRPFQVDGLVALYQAHQAGAWIRPEKLRPDLPRRFADAIGAALATEPAQRAATVHDLFLLLGGSGGEAAPDEEPTVELTGEFQAPPEAQLQAPLGREGDLAALRARLEKGDVALVGPPGIGKTHLARALGGLFVPAGGARDAADLRRAVARAARVPLAADPAETDARIAARIRDFDRVVIDGADDAAGAVLDLLAAWRGPSEFPRFVVTGRHPLTGLASCELGPLPPAAARALLLGRASIADGDDGALDELLRALGGHPLAIELASARLGRDAPAALRARMDGDWWALVPQAERKVLGRLSLFASSFSEGDARAVLGQAGALDRLRERGLLRRGGRGLSVPESLRGRARDALAPAELNAAWRAVRDRVATAAGPPWADWLDDLRAVIRWSGEHAPGEAAALGARVALPLGLAIDLGAAWDLLDGQWLARVAEPDRRAALALARVRVRRLLGQPVGAELASCPTTGLGPAQADAVALARCAAATPSDEGIAEIDRHIATSPPRVGGWWAARGIALLRLGRDPDGRGCLERALAADLDPAARVDALIELGASLGRTGDLAGGEARFREALALAGEHGMRLLEGRVHKVLGALFAVAERMGDAEAEFASAQRIARSLGDTRTVGTLLGMRAELALADGRVDQAERLLARALPMAERAGEPGVLAWYELMLAMTEEDAGRPGRAEARARRAIDLASRSGNAHIAAIGWSFLTCLLADADRLPEAQQAFAAIGETDLGPIEAHRAIAGVHVDLARARRGDRAAATRARAAFAALSAAPPIDLRHRVRVLDDRIGAVAR
jgi:tetratricopeptide (TPR) repeat protein